MKINGTHTRQPIHVLLVDDEGPFRETMVKRLARRGLDCHQAADGNECLAILEKQEVHVVILDVKMPGLSGIEVLQKITDTYPRTEVILLTGHATTSDGIEGIKSGAFDYLMKPIELEHLYNKVIQAHDKIQRISTEEKEAAYRKQMEQQMIVTERLASLGTLAAGVAHEINNPLAIISESTGWMRQLLARDVLKNRPHHDDFVTALEKVENSVDRASRITHQLLGVVGKTRAVITEVNLAELAEEAIRLIIHETRKRDIAVVRRVEPSLGAIQSDPYQLRQVLLNLLTNALHAIKSDGTITIVIEDAGDSQVVTVCDTGQGIPRENMDKIFEPFFTTKPTGEGTGLGLFVTRNIVEKLGGTLGVESEIGSGACFSILLPKYLNKREECNDSIDNNWIEKVRSRFKV
jgi:two-component system, NtrC family, sensor kinase